MSSKGYPKTLHCQILQTPSAGHCLGTRGFSIFFDGGGGQEWGSSNLAVIEKLSPLQRLLCKRNANSPRI